MNLLEFSLLVSLTSLAAGFLGSLTGMGGGIVIVPALTLVFGIDIRYAIGASLVSVIATSSGSAAAYVKEGFTNIRLGLLLEIATTLGAIAGAFLVTRIAGGWIAGIFGFVLLYSAYQSFRTRAGEARVTEPNPLAVRLKLDSTYPGERGLEAYHVRHVPAGFGIMLLAGTLSGLLGIGSGALKVLAMDRAMGVPFKVSTTTSNFMIGVTAAASAGVYLTQGYINPGLAMPVMLGVLAGSSLGTHVLMRAKVGILKSVFALVLVALALEMIYGALTGRF
jgi:uncharacterized membrane protein YfcA